MGKPGQDTGIASWLINQAGGHWGMKTFGTASGGQLFYCQACGGQASTAEALQAQPCEPADPSWNANVV